MVGGVGGGGERLRENFTGLHFTAFSFPLS